MRSSTGRAGTDADLARMIEAVHGLPGEPSPGDQARAVAEALGACLDADLVMITVRLPIAPDRDPASEATRATDTREYRWCAADRTVAGAESGVPGFAASGARLADGERVVAETFVHPVASAEWLDRWPELAAVVRVLLSDIRAQLIAEDARQVVARCVAALADARQRAAGEMERQRHSLERDLHDGAQHHMIALQLALAMVEHHLGTGDTAEVAQHIDRLRQLLASTEEVLHTTATGLLALPLADHGLVTALSSRLSTLEAVTLDIDPLLSSRRYPPEVEATVYLACLEAVSNAHRHAPGSAVTLTLRSSVRGLGFEVADTGSGGSVGGRISLGQLAARMAAVNGTLEVSPDPGGGTRVSGFVAI